jgi:hypothetical protein
MLKDGIALLWQPAVQHSTLPAIHSQRALDREKLKISANCAVDCRRLTASAVVIRLAPDNPIAALSIT